MAGETVLIVEDHQIIADALQDVLVYQGFKVVWANTGRKALDLLRQLSFDLVMLDVRLPDISGHYICTEIRAMKKRIPILMMSSFNEVEDKVVAFELGADDFIEKISLSEFAMSGQQIVARIRSVMRRYKKVAKMEVQTFGDLTIDLTSWEITWQKEAIYLRNKEFRILRHLVINKGIICNRKMLCRAVWGNDSPKSEQAIDVLIFSLRRRLKITGQKWLVTIIGEGYLFDPTPDYSCSEKDFQRLEQF